MLGSKLNACFEFKAALKNAAARVGIATHACRQPCPLSGFALTVTAETLSSSPQSASVKW
jgi:hypothetical protein